MVRFIDGVCAARSVHVGAKDKGTAGKGLRKNLMGLGEHVGFPFTKSMMCGVQVKSAATGVVSPKAPAEYQVSVALMFVIESYALGEYWGSVFPDTQPPVGMSEAAISRARDIVIMAGSSLRGASFSRLEVIKFVPPDQYGAALDGKAVVQLRSTDEAPTGERMIPRNHWFVVVGFIEGGVELWVKDWFDIHYGEHAAPILGSFLPIGISDLWSATGISVQRSAPLATVKGCLRSFAAVEPILQPVESSRRLGLSQRALRHVAVGVATAFGIQDQVVASSLGQWATSARKARSRPTEGGSMGWRYSGSELQMLAEVQTRLRTCYAMHEFVGSPRQWKDRIPLQSGVEPSMAFLMSSVSLSRRPVLEVSDEDAPPAKTTRTGVGLRATRSRAVGIQRM